MYAHFSGSAIWSASVSKKWRGTSTLVAGLVAPSHIGMVAEDAVGVDARV
jgi:hypothetical protein